MNRLRYWSFVILLFPAFPSLAQDLMLMAKGFDMHAELQWKEVPGAGRYEIWRKDLPASEFKAIDSSNEFIYLDWTGREDDLPDKYEYFVKATTASGDELVVSDTISIIVQPLSEDQFLDMVQEYSLRYFYDYAHPISGMTRERLGSGDLVTTGGSGFGAMAILVGVERGWISREDAIQHFLKLVSFLQFADSYRGVFPHWMDGSNGNTFPFSQYDDGGDLVETSFLMQGLLCVREYFDRNTPEENAIRAVITSLWEAVDWNFYTRNNSGVLYWHWSPNHAWKVNLPIRGYNEALITYLLALASPTNPIPASYYHTGWAGGSYVNGNTWYGHTLCAGPPLGGPLFFAHYSFQGFDPRNTKDSYCNYFEQNKNHTLINRSWCMANPLHHEDYSEQIWGLTASDDPWGYAAHAPGGTTDNGTITPTAAASSIPYTPQESLAAMRAMYRRYGLSLWGIYGFKDAFNPGENWFASSYLAIDQGPIINMIENYRSGLLWKLFMQNPEIGIALEKAGFEPDITNTDLVENSSTWTLFPSPVSDQIFIRNVAEIETQAEVRILSFTGEIRHSSIIHIGYGTTSCINLPKLPSGLYYITISDSDKIIYVDKLIIQN